MNRSPSSFSRRRLLWAAAGVPLLRTSAAQALTARVDGDDLVIMAPDFHFISGKSLRKLRDGLAIIYQTMVTISTDNFTTYLRRSPQRFAVSFAIWEEKFKVSRLGNNPRSGSNLSLQGVERWLLENIDLTVAGIPADRPFWLKLEMRASDPRDQNNPVGEGGLSLTKLVEIFSRPPTENQDHWTLTAGPMRLDHLRHDKRTG